MSTIAIRIQTAGRVVQDLRVEPGAGSNGRALRVKVPPDSRVEMQDLVSGLGPQPLAVKRVGNALHVNFQGKASLAPDLVLEDFFHAKDRQTPGLLGRTSDHGMQDYVPEQSAGQPTASLADGASADLALPGQPLATAAGAATAGAEAGAAGGVSWGAIGLGVGVLAVAGVAAGGGGGGNDAPATPTVAAPRALSLEAQADGRVHVTGLADPGASVTVRFPDGTERTVTALPDGRFEALSAAAQHSGSVAATARDAGGHASPEATAVYDDHVAPAAPSLAFAAQADGHAMASGTAEAGALLKVLFPDHSEQTVQADAQGRYSLVSVNTQTTGTGSAVAVDAAGNASAATEARLVDRVAPTTAVSIDGLQDDQAQQTGTLTAGATTNDATPLLQGHLSAPLETGGHVLVLRDGKDVGEAAVNGVTWTFQEALRTEGEHVYTAVVTDAAGNRGPVSAAAPWIFDFTPPQGSASFLSVVDDSSGENLETKSGAVISDAAPELRGYLTGMGPGEHLSVSREGLSAAEPTPVAVVGAGVIWSLQDSGLVDHTTYHYQLHVVDAAGNETLQPSTFTLTYVAPLPNDASAPEDQALVWQAADGRTRLWHDASVSGAAGHEAAVVPDHAAGPTPWTDEPGLATQALPLG